MENSTTLKSEGSLFVDDDLLLHHRVNYYFIIDLASLSIRTGASTQLSLIIK